ncbi:hypothetical protein QJS04_geneDACA014820 [Acorus gramineus]|uniref:Endonuclease/exonuclease/phosphatase domain-containing protein n=1 Tax=Acorus gramineus TaxID=55184 RepID=A0AAV9BN09_ACOGR|nr:hypothetical protein QJS04_geneDACA014820 [Acorus gramineus]
MWVLWDPSKVFVDLIQYTTQFLHCKISSTNFAISPYYLTTIYSSNSAAERDTPWEGIEALAITTDTTKWILGGDFNEIHYSHEKIGGQSPHTRRMHRFNGCIANCRLQDMRTLGPLHTWSNNKENRIASKLDRVLVNLQWLQAHAHSFVQSLAPGLSDHSPLQVFVIPSIPTCHAPGRPSPGRGKGIHDISSQYRRSIIYYKQQLKRQHRQQRG